MAKYINYFKYVFRHKYYVFLECKRLGILWRGVVHDLSKFKPSEFIPYANFFYNKPRDNTGYYKPTDTGNKAFDFAWLLHQKVNKHHWQWWVLPEDEGGIKILPMPEKYYKEMVADWVGAGKAQGFHSPHNDRYYETRKWYGANKHKMSIHPETRLHIEKIISYNDTPSDKQQSASQSLTSGQQATEDSQTSSEASVVRIPVSDNDADGGCR